MPPERIVSLCPSTTETLIDFGLADKLVGITRFCIHPAEIVRELPRVGGTKSPDLDRIRAAHPDLIFMNAEENRREDHSALNAEFEVDVSEPRAVGEVPALLRRWGVMTGCAKRGASRADDLERALTALDAVRASFRYAYLIWRDPWMAVAGDTYVSDLFARAGGTNVVAAEDRYPVVELAEIATARPDVVFLPDEPYPFSDSHIPEVRAGVNTRVELVSGDDLCWHGVRSIAGAKLAADLARKAAGIETAR